MQKHLISLALLSLVPLMAASGPVPAIDTQAVDKVFAAYTDQTPGCALGVYRFGQTVYAKGYGLADLSFGVPITPATVFDIGSTSKQFTTVALLWLVHEGKLKLDDTVQQHLPDLAKALPQPITLRQMLNHTAGLPDYNLLLLAAGEAEENVTGDEDALRVIRAGVPLNFKPGSEFSYSNTGYFLASQVVEKNSGQKLDEFLQARLFKPLGMAATHVRTDHTQVVKQRATAYAPNKDGFGINMSNWNQAGDGAVQSTVQDLALWEAELLDPKVLPAPIIEWMKTPGVLNDGQRTIYGMGWMLDPYRGVARIHHSGAWGGYRAMTMRFPAQRTAIALTCNRADADTEDLAEHVADVVLADALTPLAPLSPPPAGNSTVPAAELDRLKGLYLSKDGSTLAEVDTGTAPGSMTFNQGDGPTPLTVVDGGELRTRRGSRLLWTPGRQSFEFVDFRDGARLRYERIQPQALHATERQALVGRYRHAGLDAQWQLKAGADGSLLLTGKGLGEGVLLEPINAALLRSPLGIVHVQRNAKGQVTALRLANDRLRYLVMTRT